MILRRDVHKVVVAATIPLTVEKFFPEYLRQLLDAGFSVDVVSSPGEETHTLRTRFPAVVFHEVRMTRDVSVVDDLVSLVRMLVLFGRLRPSAVIAMTPKASLLTMIAGWVTDVPYRLYATGGLRLEGLDGAGGRMLWVVERLTCGAASDVVANSGSLAEAYRTRRLCSGAKLRTVGRGSSHGVDAHHFSPRGSGLDQPAAAATAPIVVGFVGRLTHDKGIDTLIDGCAMAYERGTDLSVLVVGAQDEPDSKHYLDRLRQQKFPVEVADHLADVRPVYARMDVNVLPSLREGFPNVVLEAAAMEVPSIVSDATGCVDSVHHGVTGLVAPVSDARSLADAIVLLASDPALRRRMGTQARAWVLRHFQPEAVVAGVLVSLVRAPVSSAITPDPRSSP